MKRALILATVLLAACTSAAPTATAARPTAVPRGIPESKRKDEHHDDQSDQRIPTLPHARRGTVGGKGTRVHQGVQAQGIQGSSEERHPSTLARPEGGSLSGNGVILDTVRDVGRRNLESGNTSGDSGLEYRLAPSDPLPAPTLVETIAESAANIADVLPGPNLLPLATPASKGRDLLGTGASNKEIAEALTLTEGTVKNYISSILTKTGLRDRTQAALLAVRLRLGKA